MSSASNPACQMCGTATTLRCSLCRQAHYCSQEHNVQGWPTHQADCQSPTSGTRTVTGLLFPAKETQPRLVQVEYKLQPSEDYPEHIEQLLDFKPWFGKNTVRPHTIDRIGRDGPALGRTLTMFFNDNFFADGDPLNKCAQTVVSGGSGHRWGGDLLVLRAREPTWKYIQYYNATMDDLEPMIVYLREYGRR